MHEFDGDSGTELYTPGIFILIQKIKTGQESEWLDTIKENDKNNKITLYCPMNANATPRH